MSIQEGLVEKILVFIPMYNCAAQIPRVLAQLDRPEIAARIAGVLCVDNQSKDGTLDAARAGLAQLSIARRTLLRNDNNYGLGGSHKVAIQHALENGYSHLVVLHGDDQGSIDDLMPWIANGAFRDQDCLLGARFMPKSRLVGYSFLRTAANGVFNLIFSVVAGFRLYDLGSGLNMYRVAIFADGFHRKFADNLTFNYYLILGTAFRGFSHRFFPLTWREDDQVSNAKLFRQGLQMLHLLGLRIFAPRKFMSEDHRAVRFDAYPSSVVETWGA